MARLIELLGRDGRDLEFTREIWRALGATGAVRDGRLFDAIRAAAEAGSLRDPRPLLRALSSNLARASAHLGRHDVAALVRGAAPGDVADLLVAGTGFAPRFLVRVLDALMRDERRGAQQPGGLTTAVNEDPRARILRVVAADPRAVVGLLSVPARAAWLVTSRVSWPSHTVPVVQRILAELLAAERRGDPGASLALAVTIRAVANESVTDPRAGWVALVADFAADVVVSDPDAFVAAGAHTSARGPLARPFASIVADAPGATDERSDPVVAIVDADTARRFVAVSERGSRAGAVAAALAAVVGRARSSLVRATGPADRRRAAELYGRAITLIAAVAAERRLVDARAADAETERSSLSLDVALGAIGALGTPGSVAETAGSAAAGRFLEGGAENRQRRTETTVANRLRVSVECDILLAATSGPDRVAVEAARARSGAGHWSDARLRSALARGDESAVTAVARWASAISSDPAAVATRDALDAALETTGPLTQIGV